MGQKHATNTSDVKLQRSHPCSAALHFGRVILDMFLNLKKICNSRFHGPRTFVEFSQLTVSFPGKAELFHDMHVLRNKPMNFDRSNTRSCLKI
jgi:hypothetical protein